MRGEAVPFTHWGHSSRCSAFLFAMVMVMGVCLTDAAAGFLAGGGEGRLIAAEHIVPGTRSIGFRGGNMSASSRRVGSRKQSSSQRVLGRS